MLQDKGADASAVRARRQLRPTETMCKRKNRSKREGSVLVKSIKTFVTTAEKVRHARKALDDASPIQGAQT